MLYPHEEAVTTPEGTVLHTLLSGADAASMVGSAITRAPTHGAPGGPPHASGLPGQVQLPPVAAAAGDEEVSMVSICLETAVQCHVLLNLVTWEPVSP